MLKTKAIIQNTKSTNYLMAFLLAANGFLLVGFVGSKKGGVKNYSGRTFTVAPGSHDSTHNRNIVADVEKFMVEHRKETSIAKSSNNIIPETIFEIAQTYKGKGELSPDLRTKARNFSLALIELEKLPKKNPQIVKQVKPARQQIKSLLQSISTIGVMLGDHREKTELLYGQPDKVEISDRYYPIGSISYLTYDKTGIQFGLRNNRVFAINIRSNFKGVVGGVQIGDNIIGIKALYRGRISELPGNNFVYQSKQAKNKRLTFVFNDQDNMVDGVKLFDVKLYGSWSTVLQ